MSTLITLVSVAAEAEHHGPGALSYIIAGAAAATFALLGFVTWSYRNVARRHPNRPGANSGH
jgi:hypothetical protein